MADDANKKFQKELRQKVELLLPVFARAAIGDFSTDIEVPDEDDDALMEVFMGVQVMLDVIRQQLGELRTLNESLEKKVEARTAQLLQSHKLASIGTLASGVAHELNNPLAIIVGHCDILAPGETNPKRLHSLDKIKDASLRMKRIIDHLRVYSRSGSGPVAPVDLSKVIRASLVLHGPRFRENGVELALSLSEGLPPILGDETKLESVFQNLFSNSGDAFETVKDGRERRIALTTALDGGGLRITYRDNAGGMTKDVRDRIFDPFFTTKPPGKGTGLGMSIVKNTVEEYRGTIDCQSVEGEGTVFEIVLPAAPAQAAPRAQQRRMAPANGVPVKSERRRVLVIDDEPEILDLVRLLLEKSHEVTTALPSEALAVIDGGAFDLILTDYRMPGLSPLEVLARLGRTSTIPLVLMTGQADADAKLEEILRKGRYRAVLTKPFSAAELRKTIHEALFPSKDPGLSTAKR